MAARPDFSEYVVHFTKNRTPHCVQHENPSTPQRVKEMANETALDRLISILNERVIYATPMPWTRRAAVCFTECVWGSLLDHATEYSSYGIAFAKSFLFQDGGGPAFYMRQDLYHQQEKNLGWHDDVWAFITPFVPEYASQEHRDEYWRRSPLDYTREREWRVAHDLHFGSTDVAFVIVASHGDAAQIPTSIPRDSILLMDNYRRVNQLYPWHHF